MKTTRQQKNNGIALVLVLIVAMIVSFTLCHRESMAQSTNNFTITAQCIETPDSSQVGWEYFESPLLGKLTDERLSIFYEYRDYGVIFSKDNKLKSRKKTDFAGNITYSKSSTGTDKWSYQPVKVRQWHSSNDPTDYLELYFPKKEILITYIIQFNHLTSNQMKVTNVFIPGQEVNEGDVLTLKSAVRIQSESTLTGACKLSKQTAIEVGGKEGVVTDYKSSGNFYQIDNGSGARLYHNSEIALITKEVTGVVKLPATEDMFKQLKPGDRVLLKDDCKDMCIEYPINEPVGWNWAGGMNHLSGTEVKIRTVTEQFRTDRGDQVFMVENDNKSIHHQDWVLPRQAIKRINFIAKG